MDDLLEDGIAAVLGRDFTADRLDDARGHLVMVRSLLAEVRGTSSSLVPPEPRAWRSMASDGYAQGLDDLRMRLACAVNALVGAEADLEVCIRRLEVRLEAQSPVTAGSR